MPDLRRDGPGQRDKRDAERLAAIATAQYGVVSSAQLRAVGVSSSTISRWVRAARLHRIHPGVYALGHAAVSIQGRLHAARLYAGPMAVFSHTTAAWLWHFTDVEPAQIHITVPGRRRSLPGIRAHQSRSMVAVHCRGFQVTAAARTLLDLAGVLSARQLRRALAEADYRGLLDPPALRAELGHGRLGSASLRAALKRHLPQLAQTFSVLEDRFLELCGAAGLPMPEVNARVGSMRIDALWREHRVAVELDGAAAHGGWAAIKRDRRRELALRASGFQVARYTWEQVTRDSATVAADLRRLLATG